MSHDNGKMTFDTVLFMSNDVATELKISLEDLGRNCLAETSGEKIAVAVHWVLEVSVRLTEVR